MIGEFDEKPGNESVAMLDITATIMDILELRNPAYCRGNSSI